MLSRHYTRPHLVNLKTMASPHSEDVSLQLLEEVIGEMDTQVPTRTCCHSDRKTKSSVLTLSESRMPYSTRP